MQKYVSPILEKIRNTSYQSDLDLAHKYASSYIESLDTMPIYPRAQDLENLQHFSDTLSEEPSDNAEILNLLGTYGSPATTATTSGRYFGFVVGGALPSALAAKWISDIWDQNPALHVMSPICAKLEFLSEKWLRELLGLPDSSVAGFVSGSSTAIMCGLVTARNQLLKNLGWDVTTNGLFGAPEIKVVLGESTHSTVLKMLSVIGLGSNRIIKVPMDHEGRLCTDQLPELDQSTLLILQAGNVFTGAFDDFETICPIANQKGAWVHVDGAFGMWAAANPTMSHLTKGINLANSWSFDGHKTLNTPYDCGVIMCKDAAELVHAMHMDGSYLVHSKERDSMMYSPEMSRRGRGVDLWATLCGLGKNGVAQLVEELHQKALYFASELEKNGFELLNDVVFNQVLVHYKNDQITRALTINLQDSRLLWLAGAAWQNKAVIRISVSNYKTTYEDIDLCVKEFIHQAAQLN